MDKNNSPKAHKKERDKNCLKVVKVNYYYYWGGEGQGGGGRTGRGGERGGK